MRIDFRECITYYSHKTRKGEALGYLTGIMYLSPARESGRGNLCPWSTGLCRRWCLKRSGKMRFDGAKRARIRRTRFFLSDRPGFLRRLRWELKGFRLRAAELGFRQVAIRLNGTSDVPWESVYPALMPGFSDVRFYDYTKSIHRIRAFAAGTLPANYHLTFSLSETERSEAEALEALALGVNVAAVFGEPIPGKWFARYPVIDGDHNDLRFLDPRPAVIALRPKGISLADRPRAKGFIL